MTGVQTCALPISKSAELRDGLSSVRRAGGPPKGPSKLAPIHFSDVPIAPAPRATRSRLKPATRSGAIGPRTTRTDTAAPRAPAWVVWLAIGIVAVGALAGVYFLGRMRSAREQDKARPESPAPPKTVTSPAPKTPPVVTPAPK